MAIKVDPITIIPNQQSAGSDWIEWHKTLTSNFGKKQANALFLKAWNRRKGSNASTNALRTYMAKQGIELEKSVGQQLTDSAYDWADSWADIFKFGKITTFVVVGGGLALTGLLIYNIAKNPIAAANAAAKLKGGFKR